MRTQKSKGIFSSFGADAAAGESRRPVPPAAALPIIGLPPTVELLEGRCLLSTSFNSVTGVLTVSGNVNNNTIEVYRTTANGIRVDEAGTLSSWYTASSVNRIDVFGFAGADTFTIYTNANVGPGDTGVGKPTILKGGDGNDTITGGDNNDTIYGESDNDSLDGGDSDDTIYGCYGADSLEGGAQNDILWGSNGNNDSNEAAQNDTLWGEDGSDTLQGETGDDILRGGGGADYCVGFEGNDTFTNNGDGATDTLDGGNGTDSVGSDYETADVRISMEL